MNANNYGFMFNDISIHNNEFHKKAKNELGKYKINHEISFYLYVKHTNFPMPKLLLHQDGFLSIEYINHARTLIDVIDESMINTIKHHLQAIHNVKKQIDQATLLSVLNAETNLKIMKRYHEYDWTIMKPIRTVNHIQIRDVYYYCDIIHNKLKELLKDRDYYSIVHGDIHLGNILLDPSNNMYFIDPKGFFGNTDLYGIHEYDYAKLMFGISGYSIFDTMDITELDIKDENINIEFIRKYEYVFTNMFDEITTLFCLSIWLGNNSCFTSINKKITSLMIAYYYCEKYLTPTQPNSSFLVSHT